MEDKLNTMHASRGVITLVPGTKALQRPKRISWTSKTLNFTTVHMSAV